MAAETPTPTTVRSGTRSEPKGVVYVGYLSLSAIASLCLALLLHDRVPGYGAGRWFWGFFWLTIGAGALPLVRRAGGSTIRALLVAAWFALGSVVSVVSGFEVFAALTFAAGGIGGGYLVWKGRRAQP
jgi:hypothetical protein